MNPGNEQAHGYGRYSHGCRCSICRAAKAAYVQGRRKRARELASRFTDDSGRHLAIGVAHGTVSAYDESGCRCRPCTSALSAKRLAEHRRQRARRAA